MSIDGTIPDKIASAIRATLSASRMAAMHHREFIADAPDQAAFARVAEEVGYFDRLLADWRAWSAQPDGSFPDWCERHGRRHAFSMKIYYRK